MKAIRIHWHGGPEVLGLDDVALPSPGPGEVLVGNRAIGVNFVDTYLRSGAFPVDALPFTLGKEGAGVVLAVGEGVPDFAPGDRVAYVETPGAYAEQCLVPARYLLHLPEAVDFETAAASMLKGLTAQYLLRRTFRVEAGQTVLVQAAAGGVGLILTQWARHLGATVIGTVGSARKAELARRNGCDHVIDNGQEDFVARVREITEGRGCQVVYDGVGKATFPSSLDCLAPFGTFVGFGFASGPIPPFDFHLLLEKGSLFATFPGLTQHVDRRADILAMGRELFDVIASGAVKVRIHDRLPLSQAAEAHRRLEARETTGGTILLP